MFFSTAKKSLAAYKGHLNVTAKSFTTLLKIQPSPTPESVMKLYSRLQNRLDATFNSLDKLGSLLEDTELITREKIELETESKDANSCYKELLGLQLEMKELFATFQSSHISTPAHRLSPPTPSITDKPIVRLTALDPPSWNGIKADFYTWKRKFIHIMEEAKIVDELTQKYFPPNTKF